VLQRVAVFFLVIIRKNTVYCSVLQLTVCCSVLQCVAACCSVLRYVAVCCSVLQRGADAAAVDTMTGIKRDLNRNPKGPHMNQKRGILDSKEAYISIK